MRWERHSSAYSGCMLYHLMHTVVYMNYILYRFIQYKEIHWGSKLLENAWRQSRSTMSVSESCWSLSHQSSQLNSKYERNLENKSQNPNVLFGLESKDLALFPLLLRAGLYVLRRWRCQGLSSSTVCCYRLLDTGEFTSQKHWRVQRQLVRTVNTKRVLVILLVVVVVVVVVVVPDDVQGLLCFQVLLTCLS